MCEETLFLERNIAMCRTRIGRDFIQYFLKSLLVYHIPIVTKEVNVYVVNGEMFSWTSVCVNISWEGKGREGKGMVCIFKTHC